MRRILFTLVATALVSMALAQPFQWGPEYAATAKQGGTLQEVIFGDITTLSPVMTSSATENSLIGLYAGPGLVYRDWVGTKAFKDEEGNFNTYWASEIEEVVPDLEFVVTVREGWQWSDGTEMTADDAIMAWRIIGDPEVESNSYSCSWVDDQKVEYEKLGTYQYKITLPSPQVNGLAVKDCGTVPAHIFGPVYEAEGAAGVKAFWGVDADVSTIVSGGPYILTEFRQGERLVFEKNPFFGENVQAADGTPLPGPDGWVVTITEDQNQVLAQTLTGQNDFYWPTSADQVAAINQAVQDGTLTGTWLPNVGPSTSVDFLTFNFNNTNECKAAMFRNTTFRQAFSIMFDRNALVQAAVGGLGFPAIDYRSEAVAPYISDNPPFEYDPEKGVEMLRTIGFTAESGDGVLVNPETGCRAEFDLQFNTGNNRRAQLALVISQQLEDYGVRVNAREVSVDIWSDSITGTTLPRAYDYDAQIWGLAGGDVDNPGFINGLRRATNLNAWNKSMTDVQPWELQMERIDVQTYDELDQDARIQLWKQQAALLRQQLPIVPLISPSYHLYVNAGNVWDAEAISATSTESPYRPGNFRELLTTP
jgi:peptide/nickel transport system substrate-binding protein